MVNYEKIIDKEIYYLDFETNKKKDLFLLGIEHSQKFTCYVLNKELSPICENENYKKKFNISYEDPESLLPKLLKKIEIIQNVISKDTLPNVYYLNVARIAKAWKNKFYMQAFNELPELRKYSNNFYS